MSVPRCEQKKVLSRSETNTAKQQSTDSSVTSCRQPWRECLGSRVPHWSVGRRRPVAFRHLPSRRMTTAHLQELHWIAHANHMERRLLVMRTTKDIMTLQGVFAAPSPCCPTCLVSQTWTQNRTSETNSSNRQGQTGRDPKHESQVDPRVVAQWTLQTWTEVRCETKCASDNVPWLTRGTLPKHSMPATQAHHPCWSVASLSRHASATPLKVLVDTFMAKWCQVSRPWQMKMPWSLSQTWPCECHWDSGSLTDGFLLRRWEQHVHQHHPPTSLGGRMEHRNGVNLTGDWQQAGWWKYIGE